MFECTEKDREAERLVIKRLERNGFRSRLVGGCVRDYLLHHNATTRGYRTPMDAIYYGGVAKDIDIVTDATPDTITKLFDHVLPEGQQYGVSFVCDYGRKIDVATLRKDIGYSDGRRPDSVTFTTSFEEDAMRRDFTINSLYMDAETGEIFDYTGGLQDLKVNRVIRAVGDATERIKEDALRILRAVRFAAKLGFYLHQDLVSAVCEYGNLLKNVSAERIADEFFQIIRYPGGYKMLESYCILQYIFPRLRHHQRWAVWSDLEDYVEAFPKATNAELMAVVFAGSEYHKISPSGQVTTACNDLKTDYHTKNDASEILGAFEVAQTFNTMEICDCIDFARKRNSLKTMQVLSVLANSPQVLEFYKEFLFIYGDIIAERQMVTGKQLEDWGYQPSQAFSPVLAECRRLQDARIFKTTEEFRNFVNVHNGSKNSQVRLVQKPNSTESREET